MEEEKKKTIKIDTNSHTKMEAKNWRPIQKKIVYSFSCLSYFYALAETNTHTLTRTNNNSCETHSNLLIE